jgi:hypothetical protein
MPRKRSNRFELLTDVRRHDNRSPRTQVQVRGTGSQTQISSPFQDVINLFIVMVVDSGGRPRLHLDLVQRHALARDGPYPIPLGRSRGLPDLRSLGADAKDEARSGRSTPEPTRFCNDFELSSPIPKNQSCQALELTAGLECRAFL